MAWLDGHTREEECSWAATVMPTTPTKPAIEAGLAAARLPSWPLERSAWPPLRKPSSEAAKPQSHGLRPTSRDALQALLAFSALHQQVRQRRALASRHEGFETVALLEEFEAGEQFVLDEVLQLVAERAIAITGADGLGIALAENNEIVLRASAGAIKPDVGCLLYTSSFSGPSVTSSSVAAIGVSKIDPGRAAWRANTSNRFEKIH